MPTDFQSLFAEGYRARREGNPAHSRAIFLDCVRHAAEACDEPSLAEALCGLARAERDIGNCPAALHHYANAATIYRHLDPPARLAHALRHQADLLRESNRPTEAEPLYREAESIYRQSPKDHTLDLANTLRGLALLNPGGTAKPFWQEAHDLYATLNIEAGVAECDAHLTA